MLPVFKRLKMSGLNQKKKNYTIWENAFLSLDVKGWGLVLTQLNEIL